MAVFDELREGEDCLRAAKLPAAMRLLGMNPTEGDASGQFGTAFCFRLRAIECNEGLLFQSITKCTSWQIGYSN